MSGRNAPRSKNGCSTCRRRKVKCDEERPVCKRCLNLRLSCEWGVPVKRRESRVRSLQPAQPRHSYNININHNYGNIAAFWNAPAVVSDLVPAQQDVFLPPVSPFDPNPLYPTLSGSEVPCANSLILTEHDLKYFQYFPSSSVVFYYMKSWQWSSFCYLYQGPAATSKVIMRMILALSASDMHRNGLVVRSPGRPTAEDHARYHYSLAVKEFRQLLETPREVSHMELEMIFATMFLMVTYEWQFGHFVRHLQLHLQGVRSLLESHPQLFQLKDINGMFLDMSVGQADEAMSKVSFIPEQLLLWILYVDVSCRPIGLTESLYDYVLNSGNPALHPDYLHKCARLWGRCFWGSQYPDQEVLDDVENHRGLELLHEGMGLRYKTWQLVVDPTASSYTTESLFTEMMGIRDKYSDLFITARFAGGSSARRTLNTIYFAVSTFYAQFLFHRRLLCSGPPTILHRQTVTSILEITRKQYAADPKLLRRLHWPLLMAVIETDNDSDRVWLRQRLGELCEYHSEYVWANRVAEEVLSQQDVSQGQYANLAELLRNHHVNSL
ncbi:hypothetical protein ASPWEDRAFT_39631 [Aspergillus wentii DTO 134E9]|uniref:Zn(2)-C6 fungal-type domain-containing protein n=1 Tax=Aspergillus wentii DTO 134E9 TaxID=1073089 RepID=A0A1L9RSL8_ASPWE|nr:uncharacterized protein ASPWEDRAFT_39631 [Aspergillus wentii DTO 134E9]OJJ37920.1 hypothetical protein ASPWEDRAFT_39631 [Aspergillus wentii DTO 134E9]